MDRLPLATFNAFLEHRRKQFNPVDLMELSHNQRKKMSGGNDDYSSRHGDDEEPNPVDVRGKNHKRGPSRHKRGLGRRPDR
jgi:hypothetical protein